MADNLEYVCKECGFNWITLNGEHYLSKMPQRNN